MLSSKRQPSILYLDALFCCKIISKTRAEKALRDAISLLATGQSPNNHHVLK
jgi:hypothetical protein